MGHPNRKRITLTALAAGVTTWTLAACGGVSEERVGALESQVSKLSEAQSGAGIGELEARLDTFEKTTQEALAALSAGGTAGSAGGSASPGGPEGGAAAPSSSAGGSAGAIWSDVAVILGAGSEGVTVEEDTYTVDPVWLRRQVQALAMGGKGPKFGPGKKGGVALKGVKPKTLFASLGFKNNDAIVGVGETEITSTEDLVEALKKLPASDPVVVKIQRKKGVIEHTYVLAQGS